VTYERILEQSRRNTRQFVGETIRSVEELGRVPMGPMEESLKDYDLGKRQGRYVEAELPSPVFPDKFFDLAVCSHFLFLCAEHLPEAFHRSAILELCRLAPEVRIFPLLALDGCPSPFVPGIVNNLNGSYEVSLETMPYEFQTDGKQVMWVRLRHPEGGRSQAVARGEKREAGDPLPEEEEEVR
jgi:hypothetical protein